MSSFAILGTENVEPAVFEAAMLREDLGALFRQYADRTAVFVSTDLDQPTEVILSGTYKVSENEEAGLTIHRRMDESGANYLVRQNFGSSSASYFINSTGAISLWYGTPELSVETLSTMRDVLRPRVVTWSLEKALEAVETRTRRDPYAYMRLLTQPQ